jgi:hypothetical protein
MTTTELISTALWVAFAAMVVWIWLSDDDNVPPKE